ncbi:MAG: DsbA family protein [Bdellovibrio sp.]|nr:DsbA family protein [Bdellovibrio sp.]
MKNTASKNAFLLVAILSTLVAIGVHIYLTQHFYAVKFGTLEGSSVCNINATFNCDTVTASKFSSFLGIPMAMWGVATNLILLFLLCITRWNLVQDRSQTSRYAFIVAGLTVLGSIIMGGISMFAMTAYCIFCISTYVLSLIGFFGAWKGADDVSISNIKNDIQDSFVTERWFLGSLIAIPVFAFLANFMYTESHGYGEMEKIAKQNVAYWASSPEQKFTENGLILQKGSETAVMTIVEFADFLCPHCKHAAPSLHTFTNNHPDVKLIFKPWPIDGTCNEAVQGGGDGLRCALATSVICSEKLDKKGWVAHDYIFENQENIFASPSLDKHLEGVAKVTGISLEDLNKCLKDPATAELIRSMAKEGAEAKIQGTPTVFVNGRLLNGGQMIPILEETYKTLKK